MIFDALIIYLNQKSDAWVPGWKMYPGFGRLKKNAIIFASLGQIKKYLCLAYPDPT